MPIPTNSPDIIFLHNTSVSNVYEVHNSCYNLYSCHNLCHKIINIEMTISTCTCSSLARNISSAAESKGISVHSGCIKNTFGKNISMGNPNAPVFIPKDVHSMPKSTPDPL